MSDEPSLTDFVEDGEDGVAPADVTYEWSSENAVCPDCGGQAERRWRDGEAFVCADCKDW